MENEEIAGGGWSSGEIERGGSEGHQFYRPVIRGDASVGSLERAMRYWRVWERERDGFKRQKG